MQGGFFLSFTALCAKKDFLCCSPLWNIFWLVSSPSSVLLSLLWESWEYSPWDELKVGSAQEAEIKSVSNSLFYKQKPKKVVMFYPALGYFENLFCLQNFNSAVSLSTFPSICVDFPFAKGLLSGHKIWYQVARGRWLRLYLFLWWLRLVWGALLISAMFFILGHVCNVFEPQSRHIGQGKIYLLVTLQGIWLFISSEGLQWLLLWEPFNHRQPDFGFLLN